MKIKEIDYILACKECGKTTIQPIKRRITEIEMKCPSCHQNKILKVIGKVEHFDDMGFATENGKYSKLKYSLKPVLVNGEWLYRDPNEVKAPDFSEQSLTWKAKEEQWETEEKLDVAVIDEI